MIEKSKNYESPQIDMFDSEIKDILTVSSDEILEDDKTWGDIS